MKVINLNQFKAELFIGRDFKQSYSLVKPNEIRGATEKDTPELGHVFLIEDSDTGKCKIWKSNYDSSD